VPTFSHSFTPPAANPVGTSITLDVREIESAGLLEVLQTPGAALGSWAILGALLEPKPEFQFREQLGKSREVKTALSGLFGRFVARAYATKYLGLTHFFHIHTSPMALDGGIGASVRRLSGKAGKGDFPDWAAWGGSGKLAIVEAKGCHDRGGPAAALERAYKQAKRCKFTARNGRPSFKRYAIATRWGCASPNDTRSLLHVKDPDEEGNLTEEELALLGVGVIRRHMASLLQPLGYPELSDMLLQLVTARGKEYALDAIQQRTLSLLDGIEFRGTVNNPGRRGPQGELIGGFVTRAGPVAKAEDLTPADQETLSRLNLRPTFVGIERRALEAAIKGDTEALELNHYEERLARPIDREVGPFNDNAGGWVLYLEEDGIRLKS
jgi:hypothetical protein